MPRVKGFTSTQKIEYQKELLAEKCDSLLYKNKISKTNIAARIGITPQAVHNQFKTNNISLPVLMAIITMTDPDAETVKGMLKVGD